MQIIFLSKPWTIALCFLLWPILQVSCALICLKIPDNYLSTENILFKVRKWERNGKLYESVFKIRKWKHLLPDGGAVTKGGYKKKNLRDYSKDNLDRFLIESCRAELSHLLAIIPFWVFGFFTPPITLLYMLIYAVILNLPCVIAQRYNRPRIIAIMKRIQIY